MGLSSRRLAAAVLAAVTVPLVAAAPVAAAPARPVIGGSFVQPTLVVSWTAAQWRTEFEYAKAVKMDHLIWQWTVDTTQGKNVTFYPTAMPGFHRANRVDAVGRSLAAAKDAGMKVWFGLVWSEDWWANGALDQAWLDSQFATMRAGMDEIWTKYTAYRDQIAGWYVPLEADNATDSWRDTTYQDRLAVAYAALADHAHTVTGRRVMTAPFFVDGEGMEPNEYADMWSRILSRAALDVIAMQDGMGVNHVKLERVPAWLGPVGRAVRKARPTTQFWSDLETMTPRPNVEGEFDPAPVSRVLEQIRVEAPDVDAFTSFAFSHYDSPQQGFATQYAQWKAYTDSQPRPPAATRPGHHLPTAAGYVALGSVRS